MLLLTSCRVLQGTTFLDALSDIISVIRRLRYALSASAHRFSWWSWRAFWYVFTASSSWILSRYTARREYLEFFCSLLGVDDFVDRIQGCKGSLEVRYSCTYR